MSAVLIPVSESITTAPYYMLTEADQSMVERRIRDAITSAAKDLTAVIASEECIKPGTREHFHLSALMMQQVSAFVSISAAASAKR